MRIYILTVLALLIQAFWPVSLVIAQESPPLPGSVFEDLNSNGIWDQGEPGLAGFSIALFDENGQLISTAISQEDGRFEIDGDSDRSQTVCQLPDSDWIQTVPVTAISIFGVTGNCYLVDDRYPLLFGNIRRAQISDDLNTGSILNDGSDSDAKSPDRQTGQVLGSVLAETGNTTLLSQSLAAFLILSTIMAAKLSKRQ